MLLHESFSESQLLKKIDSGASFALFSVFKHKSDKTNDQGLIKLMDNTRNKKFKKEVLDDFMIKRFPGSGYVELDGFYIYTKKNIIKDEFSFLVTNTDYDFIKKINKYFQQESFIYRYPNQDFVGLYQLRDVDYFLNNKFDTVKFNPTAEEIKKAKGATKVGRHLFIFGDSGDGLTENYQLQLLPR